MDTKKEVNRVMSELKSVEASRLNCRSSLYGALIMMRTTLIKSKEAQAQLVQAGCIPRLLNLLTPPVSTGNWLKTVDIVISILANMCLEEEDAREQVISMKGISTIVEATKCTEKESIHNRGVRAVANLMQHSSRKEEILKEVIDLEFHMFVAKRLLDTKEKECKQTYLRALRLFGQQQSALISLIDTTRAIQAVASLLKEDDEKLKHRSLRILHEFIVLRCTANFVEQILAADILEELIQATESVDNETSAMSLSVVLKLCEYENIRPPLGAAGLISAFMRMLECERGHVNHISVLNALCLCCFEAVNRHRLYQEKSLELFMSILDPQTSNGKYSVLQDRILSCLVCFLYNDECFDKLLDLNLVKAVIGHLKRVCNLSLSEDNWIKEVTMILTERKNEIQETAGRENDSESGFKCDNDGQVNDENSRNSTSPSHIDNISEENLNIKISDESASPDVLLPSDQLDQEIMDISMNDTEVIHTTGTQDNRNVFSINSPTYQMEQHSWRLEDHTSGITCKNYSEEFQQEDVISTKLVMEGGGSIGKLSPYSPLSVGSSYYSPAYPSPVHSLGSSPRHSNFQTGSFTLGSQSPRSSPAWSPTHSLQSEDTWSSSDPAGRSPTHLILSPNSQQGQFSPLINPYPASPPPMLSFENRNISESPLLISQVSNASDRTMDSQEDMFSDLPKSSISGVTQHGIGRFSSFSEVLKGEHKKPVYSSSEDEDEEGDDLYDLFKSSHEDGKSQGKKARKEEGCNVENCDTNVARETLVEKRASKSKGIKGKSKTIKHAFEPSNGSTKYTEIEIRTDSATSPNTSVPFARLNSEPCLSVISSKNVNEKYERLHEKEGSVSIESIPEYVKQFGGDYVHSSQRLTVKGIMKDDKKIFSRQCSFPGRSPHYYSGDKPSSPFGSSSPYRVQFELPFNSPSMSPFSRYSNSPYASPNPHNIRAAQTSLAGEESIEEGSSKINKKEPQETLPSNSNSCTYSSFQCQPSCSSTSQEEAGPSSECQIVSDQPSTSNSNKDEDNERLSRIKRKTEENVFVLLSRISVKTDPSQHLPRYSVLSALTKYIAVSPIPIQRCIRTLFRVFHNPHCFESVLLEQGPALIVKNLIMDQDGRFPFILFKDRKENDHQTISRQINFDGLISSSQSSETPSDFELQIQFEFGGDAYSNMVRPRNFRSDIFHPNFLLGGKSSSHGISRDSAHSPSQTSPEDLIRARIRSGISLMKAITSLALSRYGDGEIQRIWSRGTESEKLMCAISLLHMPIGCGPLHRRQIIVKHDVLNLVVPLLFCKEASLVKESIVTALSLLAHLFQIQKQTPKIQKLTNSCPESTTGSGGSDFDVDAEKCNSSRLRKNGSESVEERDYTACSFVHISDKLNLNLIVEDGRNQTKRVFRACKEILMKKSEVFAAMLGGGYAEADKVDIEFSDLNLSGFECVLHFLHGCGSGCAVIDSLSMFDTDITHCDKDCRDSHDSLCGESDLEEKEMTHFVSSSSEQVLSTNSSEDVSKKNLCEKNSPTSAHGSSGQFKVGNRLDLSPSSSIPPKESGLSDEKIPISALNDGNNIPPAPSVSAKEKHKSNNEIHRTKQIDSILDKCIDVMAVADRFLVHDLTQYLTSVLSHTCLYTRTVTDIIYLASTYKLTGLATDCIVEVLLSHTSSKDITELFKVLGLELDHDTKKMLIDVLTSIFRIERSCS